MNANFSKRFAAYFIDIIIINIICSLVLAVIPTSNSYKNLNESFNSIAQKYGEKITNDTENIDITIYEDYIEEVAPISYQMERESFISNIIIIIIYVLYYVLYQFKNSGQTIGKKLMKIKVEKENGTLHINDLIFRSFIINSVLSSLIYIILLFTTKNLNYLYATEVVSIIFGLITIISGFMCIIRKDNKTLQDYITKTKVVEVG